MAALTPGFEAGVLHPPTSIESYPLEEVVKAYEQVLNRNTASKVVLAPSRNH
ncbi:MAG: hypothetical protein KME30_07985 [Iphinoe sp. HA4291-MV1]|nr:hypothetical protein [Iphinoe sp. HA4291-MV1]